MDVDSHPLGDLAAPEFQCELLDALIARRIERIDAAESREDALDALIALKVDRLLAASITHAILADIVAQLGLLRAAWQRGIRLQQTETPVSE